MRKRSACSVKRHTVFEVLCCTNNLHNLVVSSFILLKTGKTTLTSRDTKPRLWAGFGPWAVVCNLQSKILMSMNRCFKRQGCEEIRELIYSRS